ncbi:MAG TPA: ABC transporter permease [Burkholderiales bacterium]|nr:ABC transporter permease [Burkholderiales bacterium]
MDQSAERFIEHRVEGGATVLYLTGAWRIAHLEAIARSLAGLVLGRAERYIVDGSRLSELDTAAGFTLFRSLANCGCTEAMVSTRGFDARHRRLLALVHERMQCPPAEAHSLHLGFVPRVGAAAVALAGLLRTHNAFLGAVALEAAALLRRPGRFRLRETVSQFESVGFDAVPIVALVNFLIGVVFAYLLGVQAQRYGANIFVVDGVGLAMCRELAPLLAAVIVAGRSGAAFTAQLGTMKVQEEVDAISTLGLSPIQVLVIPRLAAIVLALPLLAFVGDAAGIGGGMVVAALQLGISPAAFLERLHATLPENYLLIGLAKTPVFAAFIALIACRMGLLVARDARSVGINTTSTVVQSIVWVIVLDAVFAVVFQYLGI